MLNLDYFSKTQPKPVPAPSKPPVPPSHTPANHSLLDQIKNFMGRGISFIRNNPYATAAVFVGANALLLALANKINAMAKESIENSKKLDTKIKQEFVKEGMTATILLAGNFAVNSLLKLAVSKVHLIGITTLVMVGKLAYQYVPEIVKNYREKHATQPAQQTQN